MTNPLNNGTFTGRLANDPVFFDQAGGGKVVLVTIATEDNFLSGQGDARKAKVHFPEFRSYIPASGAGLNSWNNVHKGDLISIQYRLSAAPYEKDGETVYPGATLEIEGFPQYLESKAVTEARAAQRAVAAPAEPAAPAENDIDAQIAALMAQKAGQTVETSPFATAG